MRHLPLLEVYDKLGTSLNKFHKASMANQRNYEKISELIFNFSQNNNNNNLELTQCFMEIGFPSLQPFSPLLHSCKVNY